LAPPAFKEDTVFSSGRCNWFQITPEMIDYAAVKSIPLGPTAYNPSGMEQFSVHFPTCQFCVIPLTVNTLVVVNGSFYLAFVAFSLWMLRNLNDQYYLWKELVQVMVAAIITFPLCWLAFNQTVYHAMELYPGLNLVWLIATICLFWEFNASCVYPTLMTFRFENSGLLQAEELEKSANSSGGAGGAEFALKLVGDKTLNVTQHNVLLDPLGVQAMQNFATESFIAENVQYLIAVNNYSALPTGVEKGRQAISIYLEFIRVNARCELNLPHTMRQVYIAKFESFAERDYFTDHNQTFFFCPWIHFQYTQKHRN